MHSYREKYESSGSLILQLLQIMLIKQHHAVKGDSRMKAVWSVGNHLLQHSGSLSPDQLKLNEFITDHNNV